jgi:hypothetical protein
MYVLLCSVSLNTVKSYTSPITLIYYTLSYINFNGIRIVKNFIIFEKLEFSILDTKCNSIITDWATGV